jgi:hypothetical protein
MAVENVRIAAAWEGLMLQAIRQLSLQIDE